MEYKILICDDNASYIKRLKEQISILNTKNRKFHIHIDAGIAPSQCVNLIRNNTYDIIILDVCIKSDSQNCKTISEIIRVETGVEYYGTELYKEIKSLDLTSKIFVLSNLPIIDLRTIFNDSDIEYFNKTTSSPKQIAQYIKNYFDTGKERIFNNIFIVYGHDSNMRISVEQYIKGLEINSIDLIKKSNGGLQTIFEALCGCAEIAEGAIILLSPDDIILNKETLELNYRARQNVIFELGLFAGYLGKNKVIVLYEKHSKFEFPSDINGIYYIEYSESQKWKDELKSNLQSIGFEI